MATKSDIDCLEILHRKSHIFFLALFLKQHLRFCIDTKINILHCSYCWLFFTVHFSFEIVKCLYFMRTTSVVLCRKHNLMWKLM